MRALQHTSSQVSRGTSAIRTQNEPGIAVDQGSARTAANHHKSPRYTENLTDPFVTVNYLIKT